MASHWSSPRVVAPPPGAPGWDIPADTEILVTTPGRWKRAPAEKPADWPSSLTWIQTESVGIDAYPKWLFSGVTVTCARGSNAPSIAEYVMAEILGFEKRVHQTTVRSAAEWRHTAMGSLEGRVLGLGGLGSIGHALSSRAQAFCMRVLALRRSSWKGVPDGIEPAGSIDDLFARSDHLTLAMPLTPATRHIVGARALSHAKPGLHLINVARGGLIDQEALLAALDDGKIARATLDVTEPEPLPDGHPFYTHPKVRLTPHVSWDGEGNASRMSGIILANLDAYARGLPLTNIADPAVGY